MVRGSIMLYPGRWIAEPALWLPWTNTGRLVAEAVCHMYSVSSTDLGDVLKFHVDAYAIAVLYARSFVDDLNRLDNFSDIPKFQIQPEISNMPMTKLSVTIINGECLRAADINLFRSNSDPYCVCQVAGLKSYDKLTRFKTQVIDKTLDPVWNHEGFICCRRGQSLDFQVWDKDQFPRPDELLGSVSLNGTSFLDDGFEGRLPLSGKNAKGTIQVKITVCSTDVAADELKPSASSLGKGRQTVANLSLNIKAKLHNLATRPTSE